MSALDSPFISIVVPTYNRAAKLQDCLTALSHLDYPKSRYEIIVVDDGGSEPLDAVVDMFTDVLTIRLVRQLNQGCATARNFGVANAKGEFVAFTDDDCVPAPDWLSVIASRLVQSPRCLVGGRTDNSFKDNIYSSASQLLVDYLYEYFPTASSSYVFFTSNNMACSAQMFGTVGGFDSSFRLAAAEDRDFCRRWIASGFEMEYEPAAVVKHAHFLGLSTFVRQHFNYGLGAYRFHTLAAKQMKDKRIRLQPKSFYVQLVLYPLKTKQHFSIVRRIGLTGLMCFSQAATMLGFFKARSESQDKQFIHLC